MHLTRLKTEISAERERKKAEAQKKSQRLGRNMYIWTPYMYPRLVFRHSAFQILLWFIQACSYERELCKLGVADRSEWCVHFTNQVIILKSSYVLVFKQQDRMRNSDPNLAHLLWKVSRWKVITILCPATMPARQRTKWSLACLFFIQRRNRQINTQHAFLGKVKF